MKLERCWIKYVIDPLRLKARVEGGFEWRANQEQTQQKPKRDQKPKLDHKPKQK